MALSPEDELALIAQYRAGNHQALERLLDAHIKRIRRLAYRHRRQGLDVEDLVQEAILAFLGALRYYDAARGNRLWSYALPFVRGAVIRASSRWLGLDERGRKSYRRVITTHDSLLQDGLAEPTVAEITASTGVDEDTVQRVLLARQGSIVPLREENDLDDPDPDDQASGVILEDTESNGLDRIDEADAIDDGISRAITAVLGPVHGPKYLVVSILRDSNYYDMDWSRIANVLACSNMSLHPSWGEVIELDFPHVTVLPRNWQVILALFQTPPPQTTPPALRQWYSRARRALDRRTRDHGRGTDND